MPQHPAAIQLAVLFDHYGEGHGYVRATAEIRVERSLAVVVGDGDIPQRQLLHDGLYAIKMTLADRDEAYALISQPGLQAIVHRQNGSGQRAPIGPELHNSDAPFVPTDRLHPSIDPSVQPLADLQIRSRVAGQQVSCRRAPPVGNRAIQRQHQESQQGRHKTVSDHVLLHHAWLSLSLYVTSHSNA